MTNKGRLLTVHGLIENLPVTSDYSCIVVIYNHNTTVVREMMVYVLQSFDGFQQHGRIGSAFSLFHDLDRQIVPVRRQPYIELPVRPVESNMYDLDGVEFSQGSF